MIVALLVSSAHAQEEEKKPKPEQIRKEILRHVLTDLKETAASHLMVEVDEMAPDADGKVRQTGRRIFPTWERFLRIGSGADAQATQL